LSIRKCASGTVNSENICKFIFYITNSLGYYEIQECRITRKKEFTSQKSVPVFSEQKLMHFTCDTLGKIIKSGKPEFRTELRRMIQSKTSVATNGGIYKLENIF
jgi:hypothetical protein